MSEGLESATTDSRGDQARDRSLFLSANVVQLFTLFRAHGIPAASIKGPVLEFQLSGERSARPSADLDVLILPEDVPRVINLMRAEGFSCHPNVDELALRSYVSSGRDLVFQSEGGLIVDVKCGFVPRYFGLSYPMAGLWERVSDLDYYGSHVPVLAVADNLNFLCIHGCKHLWTQARWLSDVGTLTSLCDEQTLCDAVVWAREAGSLRMLLIGVRMSCLSVGVAMPVPLQRLYELDNGAQALVDELIEMGNDVVGMRQISMFHLRMLDRLRSRVSYVCCQVMEPTVGDWRAFRFPVGLRWLYVFIRPVRILAKLVRGRFSPSPELAR